LVLLVLLLVKWVSESGRGYFSASTMAVTLWRNIPA
jgi:hypothetical protein